MLFQAYFHLKDGENFNLDKAKVAVDPNYYLEDNNELDKRCDLLLEHFLFELQSWHDGDCTCLPCGCSKCLAESFLEIDTIKHLNKIAGYQIKQAFNDTNNIDNALEKLKNYRPIKGKSWENISQSEFDKHIPKWNSDAKYAYDWLCNYKEKYLNKK